ncbi:MAG: hypothetical protein KJ629_00710, partial [Candidatus Omnitrophica bacterium]|nr:hypothetical protein [Candidatus Omnitrophota bacterium]
MEFPPPAIKSCSMDIVVSTFSFDYTDMRASLDQINRMLSENGRAFLVLHHFESDHIEHLRRYLNQIKDAYRNLNQLLEFLAKKTENIPFYYIRSEINTIARRTYKYQAYITQITSQIEDYMDAPESEQSRAKLIGQVKKAIDIIKAERASYGRLFSNLFTNQEAALRFFFAQGCDNAEISVLEETKDYDGDGYFEVPEAYGVILAKRVGGTFQVKKGGSSPIFAIRIATTDYTDLRLKIKHSVLSRGLWQDKSQATSSVRQAGLSWGLTLAAALNISLVSSLILAMNAPPPTSHQSLVINLQLSSFRDSLSTINYSLFTNDYRLIIAASPVSFNSKEMTLTPFFPMPASRFVVVNVRDNELFLGVVSGKINLSNKTFKATTGTNIASNIVEQTIFQRIIEWMKFKRSLLNKYKARKKAEGYIKANLKFSLREINQKIPLEEIPVEFRPQTPNNKLAELAIEESTRKIIFPWAIIV